MQATLHRRLVSHPRTTLAGALGIVIAAIVIVMSIALSSAPSQTAASVQGAVQTQSSYGYMDMKMLEDNTWHLPYTAQRPLSYGEMAFIESNTFLIAYAAPVLSSSDMRFVEENTLGFDDPRSGSLASDLPNVNQANCSSLYIDGIQLGCKDY